MRRDSIQAPHQEPFTSCAVQACTEDAALASLQEVQAADARLPEEPEVRVCDILQQACSCQIVCSAQACTEDAALASLDEVQAADARLPEEPEARQDYLAKRAKELDRKIAAQERQMGRSLHEIEVSSVRAALLVLLQQSGQLKERDYLAKRAKELDRKSWTARSRPRNARWGTACTRLRCCLPASPSYGAHM